jgi:hypothetical protein
MVIGSAQIWQMSQRGCHGSTCLRLLPSHALAAQFEVVF